MKNIWIMNHYAGAMFFSKGGRHYSFSKYLRRAGYEAVVFCANAKHGEANTYFDGNSLWYEQMAKEIETPFIFVKTRTYTGNGKKRALNMWDYYRNVKKVAKEYARSHGKPDIIYASSVHPLTLVAGIQLAKYYDVKCICEVRDLWPESIVEFSNRWTKDNTIIKLLYQGERWIYKKADALIFTMEGGYNYIVERGWDKDIPSNKVYYINNGVDLEIFEENCERYHAEDKDLDNAELFKVVYTGSIRRVNNVGLLVDAMKEISDPRIKLLIWGTGDERESLQKRIAEEKLKNVEIKGWVDKKMIPSIVRRADINVVHWEMSNILRFGASFNKLFEYLAGGKPILSTVKVGYSIVEGKHCGLEANSFTPVDIARGIEELASCSLDELLGMGANAKAAAGKFDFKYLTGKLIKIIEKQIGEDG